MHIQPLVGIHNLLTMYPTWMTFAALLFLCIDVLFPTREITEGFPYNISYSSQFGDFLLLCGVMTAVDVMKRGGAPAFLENQCVQGWLLATSIVAGVIDQAVAMRQSGKIGTWADTYHNLFIVPLLVYLFLFTALPVVTFGGGTESEKLRVLGCLVGWVTLLIFDGITGRLQQRGWIMKNGFGSILRWTGEVFPFFRW